MRWSPNKAWTSNELRNGFRHFEVLTFGGKGQERWVELYAVLDENFKLTVPWTELKTFSKWTSGWLQLPKDKQNE